MVMPQNKYSRGVLPEMQYLEWMFSEKLGWKADCDLVEQAEFSGSGCGFCAVAYPQLGTNVGDVLFRRLW